MIQVSIDMSTNDETAENRIFGNVIDIQNDMLLCEYTGANFDFDNTKKIAVLEEKLKEIKKLCEQSINVNSDAYFKYIIQNILTKIKE